MIPRLLVLRGSCRAELLPKIDHWQIFRNHRWWLNYPRRFNSLKLGWYKLKIHTPFEPSSRLSALKAGFIGNCWRRTCTAMVEQEFGDWRISPWCTTMLTDRALVWSTVMDDWPEQPISQKHHSNLWESSSIKKNERRGEVARFRSQKMIRKRSNKFCLIEDFRPVVLDFYRNSGVGVKLILKRSARIRSQEARDCSGSFKSWSSGDSGWTRWILRFDDRTWQFLG